MEIVEKAPEPWFYCIIDIHIFYNCQLQIMDSTLREKLTQLTNKCDVLAKNAKYVECIDIMEEIVSIKKNVFGLDHPEFDRAS